MREERSPLYGRFDLHLLLHPFRPHEAARMLRRIPAAERAVVWGICGGVPLYLELWDTARSIEENLRNLICTPGGPLLAEGDLVLATEADAGDLARQVLYAVAAGRTKHNEIADAVRADPTRTLDRLCELRLLERLVPVTEDPRRTRRRIYRVADNFLAFWLSCVDRHRASIDRGMRGRVVRRLVAGLDDHMGPRWEEAFREHLRRLAETGDLGPDVDAVGSFWTAADEPVEIDAVAMAGSEAVLAGEAKWTREVDAGRVCRMLETKANALPRRRDPLSYSVCARDRVHGPGDILTVTSKDIFTP